VVQGTVTEVKAKVHSSTILIKAAFLCNILAEDLHCHHLAFRVGMLGLEMPRQPARSKALEVIIRMRSRGWAGHRANLPTVRMILTTWFDHLEERFFFPKAYLL